MPMFIHDANTMAYFQNQHEVTPDGLKNLNKQPKYTRSKYEGNTVSPMVTRRIYENSNPGWEHEGNTMITRHRMVCTMGTRMLHGVVW